MRPGILGNRAHQAQKTVQRLVAAGETTDLNSAAGISTALPAAGDEPFRRRARLTWSGQATPSPCSDFLPPTGFA